MPATYEHQLVVESRPQESGFKVMSHKSNSYDSLQTPFLRQVNLGVCYPNSQGPLPDSLTSTSVQRASTFRGCMLTGFCKQISERGALRAHNLKGQQMPSPNHRSWSRGGLGEGICCPLSFSWPGSWSLNLRP